MKYEEDIYYDEHGVETDLNEHWCYTVMGNWRAKHYLEDMVFICGDFKTDEERKKARPQGREFIEYLKILIDRAYDKLIAFVREQHSRLSYLALGWFLLFFGGKMTEDVKEEILKYSEWEYEKHQFKSEEEKELRKKYLSEFREKIISYVEGTPTSVSGDKLSNDQYNNGLYNLTPIKYDIP